MRAPGVPRLANSHWLTWLDGKLQTSSVKNFCLANMQLLYCAFVYTVHQGIAMCVHLVLVNFQLLINHIRIPPILGCMQIQLMRHAIALD